MPKFSKRNQLILKIKFILLVLIFPSLPTFAIKGGTKSDIRNEPWTVGIVCNVTFCGGSILKESFVLTAAQCVQGIPASMINIHYGSNQRLSGGRFALGEKIFTIRFRPETMANDIAIIKTKEPMKLDNITSKAIQLPTLLYDPEPESTVLVSGWGATKSGSHTYSNDLMAANFTVVDREACQEKFKHLREEKLITEEVFCAGGSEFGEQYIEYGDTGDPAVQNATVVGVASSPPNPPEFPSIFTRVGSFVRDIFDIINKK